MNSFLEQAIDLEGGVETILKAIPFGAENAIKRVDLCKKLKMGDRQVRRLREAGRPV